MERILSCSILRRVALVCLVWTGAACADPLDDWAWRNPLPTGNALTWSKQSPVNVSLQDVVHGNGQFVAVAGRAVILNTSAAGVIMTSSNGITWAEQSADAPGYLTTISFNDGRFTAVGGTYFKS